MYPRRDPRPFLLGLLVLFAASTMPAGEPTTPPVRDRETFLAALRAHYESPDAPPVVAGKVIDRGSGNRIMIQRGNTFSRYPSSLLAPGDLAPAIKSASWLNTSGEGTAPDLAGKVVWIEFSATWCGPCVASMPRVQELYARLRPEGLETVIVTDEPAKVFAPYLKSHGYTMPAATSIDRDLIQRRFGVTGWPTLFLVGRDGRIAYAGDPRDVGLEEILQRLLTAKPTDQGSTKPPAR